MRNTKEAEISSLPLEKDPKAFSASIKTKGVASVRRCKDKTGNLYLEPEKVDRILNDYSMKLIFIKEKDSGYCEKKGVC